MKHFLKSLIILIAFGWGISVLADHMDPVAATNKNEQTSLFKDSVGDVGGFENEINSGKDTAINGLNSSSKVLEDITGKKESEVRQTTGDLEKIRAHDLESAGAKEMNEKKMIEELYINEDEILFQEHKKDANLIADASAELLSMLMDKLKEIGIDCRQVKGSKIIEPEYYIQIKKKRSRDAKYDPHFCEELRNKYHCTDSLTLKCAEKKFGEQHSRTIRFGRSEMPDSWWFGRGTNGGHHVGMFSTDPFIQFNTQAVSEVKQKIIERIMQNNAISRDEINVEVPPQQIMIFAGQKVNYQLDEQGRAGTVQGRWHSNPESFNGTIKFYYKISSKSCTKWSEDWNEICSLK